MNRVQLIAAFLLCEVIAPVAAFAASESHGAHDPHAAGGARAAHHAAGIDSLGWPLVNFLLYAFIFRYLYKRLGAPALLDRAASFEQHLKRAGQTLDDAEQDVVSLRRRLKGIHEEQTALRERLAGEGVLIADRLIVQAEEAAVSMKNDVARRIARELHAATSEVKQSAIVRATELAREELRTLSEQDDYRLRQEALKGLF